MLVLTIGHSTRSLDELVETLREADVTTLVDVRRFPSSRRNPQFDGDFVADAVGAAGIEYRHEEVLGGRRRAEPGEERFNCLRVSAFRSYAAHMAAPAFQSALDHALNAERPCFMCAELLWWRCHRRLIAELLAARGHRVIHLLGPGKRQAHRFFDESEVRGGRLYLCGYVVGQPSARDE